MTDPFDAEKWPTVQELVLPTPYINRTADSKANWLTTWYGLVKVEPFPLLFVNYETNNYLQVRNDLLSGQTLLKKDCEYFKEVVYLLGRMTQHWLQAAGSGEEAWHTHLETAYQLQLYLCHAIVECVCLPKGQQEWKPRQVLDQLKHYRSWTPVGYEGFEYNLPYNQASRRLVLQIPDKQVLFNPQTTEHYAQMEQYMVSAFRNTELASPIFNHDTRRVMFSDTGEWLIRAAAIMQDRVLWDAYCFGSFPKSWPYRERAPFRRAGFGEALSSFNPLF